MMHWCCGRFGAFALVLAVVKKEKNGVKQEMGAYKDTLQPEQVDALVKYTRALAAP